MGGEQAHWREGESLVFDDTYEHHVWNDTEGTRVVLFLDVMRPCRFPGSFVNRAVIEVAGLTPFVQDSMRRHEVWERRFAATHGGGEKVYAVRAQGDRAETTRSNVPTSSPLASTCPAIAATRASRSAPAGSSSTQSTAKTCT